MKYYRRFLIAGLGFFAGVDYHKGDMTWMAIGLALVVLGIWANVLEEEKA